MGTWACSSTTAETNSGLANSEDLAKDGVVFSFSFVGCNRIDIKDRNNTIATDTSTANLSALKRIYSELSQESQKPELLFFLGDLVIGESNVENLNAQLAAWVRLYNDSTFSRIQTSGIELVAVPGNHEMLYYKDYGIADQKEWPLKGSSETWLKHMSPFLPKDREQIIGKDSLINQMTFSFVRHNVGFIVMNTDTYDAPSNDHPYGKEGVIPTDWIVKKVQEYQQNKSIDHIFVLGHKPYYINGRPETGHGGLPDGPTLWPKLKEAHVMAMLSAHVHDYDRMQPQDEGTYQLIAGNGGSKGKGSFFGYSTIRVLNNGEVELITKGYNKGKPYHKAVPENPFSVRDSTRLSWSKNENPYSK